MKIYELIKQKRKELKESQTTFGKRFGVSYVAVSYWERGECEAPYQVIEFCLPSTFITYVTTTCSCGCCKSYQYLIR